jgi:hypothetical protein
MAAVSPPQVGVSGALTPPSSSHGDRGAWEYSVPVNHEVWHGIVHFYFYIWLRIIRAWHGGTVLDLHGLPPLADEKCGMSISAG